MNRTTKNTIGIVSLYGLYNYGNRLQSKAVQIMLQERGYSPIVIDCRYPMHIQLKSALGKVLKKRTRFSASRGKRSMFLSFEANTDTVHMSIRQLDSEMCDSFIVGSDQIWNPSILRPELAFLQFARPSQRIALAPSFGVGQIPESMTSAYCEGLNGFSRLSVREGAGKALIKSISGKNAEVLCDPTIAIHPDCWRALASHNKTPRKQYLLAYFLGELSDETRQTIENYASEQQLETLWLSDRNLPGDIEAGPGEFISLIDNAYHVMTDSFHGTVFSLLLETPFTLFRRNEQTNTFSRLETLLRIFSLEDCIYDGNSAFDGNAFFIGPSCLRQLDKERLKLNRFLDEELERVYSE